MGTVSSEKKDVGAGKPDNVCKASETFPVLVGRGVGKKEPEEEGEGVSVSLLGSRGGIKGSLATGRRQRSTRRKVRWNDRHGSNLVEVLEFQPRRNLISFDMSDTSPMRRRILIT